MRTAILVAAKDLRQRFRDRSVIMFAVVAPLGLAVIFSQLLAGVTEFKVTYTVVDQDGGALARTFQEQVLGSLVESKLATVNEVPTVEAARADVEAGRADAAFIIPVGFTTAISAGQRSSIDVVGATSKGLATEIARSVATRFADGVAAAQLAVLTVGDLRGAPPDPAQLSAITAAALAPSVQLSDVATSLRQLGQSTYFSASMAILFLFFAAQVGMRQPDRGATPGHARPDARGPGHPDLDPPGQDPGQLHHGHRRDDDPRRRHHGCSWAPTGGRRSASRPSSWPRSSRRSGSRRSSPRSCGRRTARAPRTARSRSRSASWAARSRRCPRRRTRCPRCAW